MPSKIGLTGTPSGEKKRKIAKDSNMSKATVRRVVKYHTGVRLSVKTKKLLLTGHLNSIRLKRSKGLLHIWKKKKPICCFQTKYISPLIQPATSNRQFHHEEGYQVPDAIRSVQKSKHPA